MPRAESPQARYWILTIPYNDWSAPAELPDGIQWLRGQGETGDSGYKHWQLFVAFHTKKRLTAVKRFFTQSTHAEPSRSEAAEDYVFKDDTAIADTRFELGGKAFNRNSKTDWADAKAKAQAGRVDEVPPDVYIKYYRTLKLIAKDHMNTPQDLEDVCGVWLYGPPGVGKSHRARQDYPGAYKKPCNKWWDGYQGQEFVLLDDLDKNHKVLGHHLKIWADKYSFIAEEKGSGVHIRPKKIIVTSNYSIREIFGEDQALTDALLRRFLVINIPMRMH